MLNENVIQVLKENVWFLATTGDEPNVVPVGFKDVEEDGTLTVGAILLEKTLQNLQAGSKIAVAAASAAAEAYQIIGTVDFVTEGPLYDKYTAISNSTFGEGVMPVKCALVITPEKVQVASPNADNKKWL